MVGAKSEKGLILKQNDQNSGDIREIEGMGTDFRGPVQVQGIIPICTIQNQNTSNLTIPLRVISRPPTLTDFYGMSITVILKKTRAFYMPRFSFGGNLKISESIILLLEKSMKLEKSEFLSIF